MTASEPSRAAMSVMIPAGWVPSSELARVEHHAARLAQQIGGDRVELAARAGVLHALVAAGWPPR